MKLSIPARESPEESAGQPPSKRKLCHVCISSNRDATLDLTKNAAWAKKVNLSRDTSWLMHAWICQASDHQGRLGAFIALDRIRSVNFDRSGGHCWDFRIRKCQRRVGTTG